LNTPEDSKIKDRTDADAGTSAMTIQKWSGLASFLMVVALITSSWIYLTGNLGAAIGPLAYTVADFLYGPVWAASLVMAVFALRERIGERALRRTNLALLAAFAAACAFLAIASVRSANRHYHLIHPELHLEESATVLIVWATLIAGLTGAAWHFLGWAWVLVGSAGWTSRRLPRVLSALYVVGGIVSMLVYVLPDSEAPAGLLTGIISIWQGILLWKAGPAELQAPEN
jgi:hypothetical protein